MHVLVFDSGVGGLSVVAELRALMPDLYLSYVADDAFRPYGNKTVAVLQQRLPDILQALVAAANPDIVILACNTASTTALVQVRAALDIPVIGVVPAIKPAVAMSKTHTIAVLGTPGTVKRKYVGKLIKNFAKNSKILLHGSTELVRLAENKLRGEAINMQAVRAEIMPMFFQDGGENIDIVVLACTHFPLLVDELRAVAPYPVHWIDSGAAIARRTRCVLSGLPTLSAPNLPQTAFLIGGRPNQVRAEVFKSYDFTNTVIL